MYREPATPMSILAEITDIPRTCCCVWTWRPSLIRWELTSVHRGCPWHGPADRRR